MNTAAARLKAVTDASAVLEAEVWEWDAKLKAHAADLSARLHLDEDECRKALVHLHKWRKRDKSRNYNERAALVWKRTQELNSDGPFFFRTRCRR